MAYYEMYTSPITTINQEIRRKNMAAAASFHSAVTGTLAAGSNNNSTDPWEEMDASGEPVSGGEESSSALHQSLTECRCRTRRRMSSVGYWKLSSPPRNNLLTKESSLDSAAAVATNICPRCGKKLSILLKQPQQQQQQSGFAWSSRSNTGVFSIRNADKNSISNINLMDDPRHAEALLQSTPQLRLLSPASTDMQGAGNYPNKHNIFAIVIQAAVDRTTLATTSTAQHHHHYYSTGNQAGVGATQVHHHAMSEASPSSTAASIGGGMSEYRASLVRDRANQQAAAELASLLWVLAHEMSLEDYGTVESQVFTAVFALVHATDDKERRMAGLAALDALLMAPSADEERKAIKFANTLSNGLRAAHGDFEFLSAVSKALGHMATRTANVDFVESEVTRALEWLRTERSDRRCVHSETNPVQACSGCSLLLCGCVGLTLSCLSHTSIFTFADWQHACL